MSVNYGFVPEVLPAELLQLSRLGALEYQPNLGNNIPERFCWLFFTEVRIRIHWILIRHQRFSWMLIGIRIHRPNWIRIRNTGFHILKSVTFTFKLVLHPNKNNQCGGSGMFIPVPGSWFLPRPGSRFPVQKPIFKELLKFSPKKNFNMPSNIWVRDPGSGKKPIPNPGSRGEKGTGSRIPDPGSTILKTMKTTNKFYRN